MDDFDAFLRFESVFGSLTDIATFVQSTDGEYLYVSASFAHLLCLTRDDVIGKAEADLFLPANALQLVQARSWATIKNRTVLEEPIRLGGDDPSGRWLLLCIQPFNLCDHTSSNRLVGCLRPVQTTNVKVLDNVSRTLAELRDHLDQDLTPQSVADHAGISPKQFERCARSVFGTTTRGVINRLRMQLAKDRLRDPLLEIETIAHECGYSDASAFGRCFRRHTGVPPRDFRQRILAATKLRKQSEPTT